MWHCGIGTMVRFPVVFLLAAVSTGAWGNDYGSVDAVRDLGAFCGPRAEPYSERKVGAQRAFAAQRAVAAQRAFDSGYAAPVVSPIVVPVRELRLYRVVRDEEDERYLCKRVKPRCSRANQVLLLGWKIAGREETCLGR